MSNLTPRDVLDAARILVEKKFPYFRAAIYKIRPMEKREFGTMAMDGFGRMRWDPDVIAKWGPKATAPAFHHEINHFLRSHHERAAAIGAQPMLWNVAADAEINDREMFRNEWALPVKGAVYADVLGLEPNRTGEEYYRQLLDQQDQQPQSGGGGESGDKSDEKQDQSGDGSGSDDSDDESEEQSGGSDSKGKSDSGEKDDSKSDGGDNKDDNESDSGEKDDSKSDGGDNKDDNESDSGESDSGGSDADAPERDPSKRKGPGAGQCGGCAGNPFDEEKESEDDEPNDAPPRLTEDEREVVRQKVAQDVIEYAKSRGNVPKSIYAWAEAALKPARVPWQRVLGKLVRQSVSKAAGTIDFTFARLGRSYAARRSVLGFRTPINPGMFRPTPEVAIVVDTSGSMGSGAGSELERALSEVQGVVRSIGSMVTAYPTDAAVGPVVKVFGKASVSKLNAPGGGTDMRVGIRAADGGRPKPNVILVLTDGVTPWPDIHEMPNADLIPVLIGDQCPDPPGHIKRVVRVPLDDLKPVTVA